MYAIIETGGKQIKVEEGKEIQVEKLETTEDAKLTFENVLLVVDGEDISVGKPFVENARVQATFLRETKGKKLIVFKFRRRKNSKTKKGHRQNYSLVKIDRIIK